MFHSQGGVRPERKKRSLRLREDASPAPPDDAMLIIRSSSVGQVSASEKTFHSRFRRTRQSSQHCKGGGGWEWSGEAFEKVGGDVFFARDGKGLQKDHWGIRIRRKYTCAEETMPVYCKPSRSDVAFGTCEQVHRRHVIAQWDIEVLVFGRPWRMGEPFLAYSGASLWATSSRGFSIRSPIWGRRSDPDVTGMS